jgi:hypothetical protein
MGWFKYQAVPGEALKITFVYLDGKNTKASRQQSDPYRSSVLGYLLEYNLPIKNSTNEPRRTNAIKSITNILIGM